MGQVDKEQGQRREDARARRSVRRQPAFESEFVNRELNKEETDDYRQWRGDVENVIDRWTELLEAGYKISTKYDDYSSSPACFVIPPAEGDNAGLILTGRGGNAYRAVSEALYKHFEVFRGAWTLGGRLERGQDDPDF